MGSYFCAAPYRRACRGDDPQAARRQREERYLETYTDDDGMVVIRGRLPQEIAALLEKALEAAMDALEERRKGEKMNDRVPSDRELINRLAIVWTGCSSSPQPSPPGLGERAG